MRSSSRSFRVALCVVLMVAATVGHVTRTQAAEEARIKIDADYMPTRADGKPVAVHPWIKTEQRFGDGGLHLLKVFAGFRSMPLDWLSLQAYYARRDVFYSDYKVDHMAVLDVKFLWHNNWFVLSDRSGNEYHSNPGFYRYRNLLALDVKPGIQNLKLEVSEEARFDFDQMAFNQNDVIVGAIWAVSKQLKLKFYYDLEAKRRGKPDWVYTHVAGLIVSLKVGGSRRNTVEHFHGVH